MAFQFGNVVVVDSNQIGVIVKSWADDTYDVYVRSYNQVKSFTSTSIKHFVYDKEITDEEY